MNSRLFFLVSSLGLVLGLTVACGQSRSDAEAIRVAVPPNPNMIPLFVALELNQDLAVELVPVPGIPELAAALQGGQADVGLFFSAAGANLYNKDALADLRLWSVNVWRALYLVAPSDVDDLSDLAGRKILASFPGGAPDLVMRAAMRQAGYDPDVNFTIEYLPSEQVKQMLLAGKGDAALLPEPQASALVAKAGEQGLDLGVVVDLQRGFGAAVWPDGLIPLGATFATEAVMDEPARLTALTSFEEAYRQACAFAMTHPDEAGAMVERAYAVHFGGRLPGGVVADAIENDRLVFDSQPATELRPDLDRFLEMIVGQIPDEEFYAAP